MSVHNVIREINLADDAVADFKTTGIKADTIAESTSGGGITVSSSTTFSSAATLEGTTSITGGLSASSTAAFSGTTTFPSGTVNFSGATSITGFKKTYLTTASSTALTAAMSGSFLLVTAADKVITLPATAAGLTYTIAISAAGLSASTGLSISPNASDKIMGNGITSANDKDLINTGATDAEGDSVTLVGDGVDGWYITAITGTWAREA